MSIDDASKLDYEEGDLFFQKSRYTQALSNFERILKEYPSSAYADNALFRISQINLRLKKKDEARKNLENLVTKYPTGDVIYLAKLSLGQMYADEKNSSAAFEILTSIEWSRVPEKERPALESMVRKNYDPATKALRYLYWLVQVHEETNAEAKKAQLRNEIVLLLNDRLTPNELAEVTKKYDRSFPGGFANFRLAKLAISAGEFDTARRWITRFQNRFPQHELYRESLLLSENLRKSEEVNPLAIGLLLPLKGNHKAISENVLRGFSLAMDVFADAQVSQTPIELYIEDSGDQPEEAAAALRRLVLRRNVIAILGPLFLEQTQAASSAAIEYGVPLISLSAAEGIADLGENIFRISLTKSQQARAIATLARNQLGIRRAAILYPENRYGKEFAILFWEAFGKLGGEIRGFEGYPADGSGASTAVQKLVGIRPSDAREKEICRTKKELADYDQQIKLGLKPSCYPVKDLPPITDFEAVFIPDGLEQATQVAPLLAFYNVEGVQVLGSNLWNSKDLIQRDADGYLDGSIFFDAFYKGRQNPAFLRFMEKYYQVFGSEPGVLEATAYDAGRLVREVLTNARPNSRRSFANALKRVQNFDGALGKISFSEKRDAELELVPLVIDKKNIIELR